MKFGIDDYARALYDLVESDPKSVKTIVSRLIVTLQANRQRSLLPLIVDRLSIIAVRKAHRLPVKVATARPLNSAQHKILTDLLLKVHPETKHIELAQEILPELIGGIRLKVGDTVIDHTIKTKLNDLAATL